MEREDLQNSRAFEKANEYDQLLQGLQSCEEMLEDAFVKWKQTYKDINVGDMNNFNKKETDFTSNSDEENDKRSQEQNDLQNQSENPCMDSEENNFTDVEDCYLQVMPMLDCDEVEASAPLTPPKKESMEMACYKSKEMKNIVNDISKTASESKMLREKMSLIHCSLTLLEMKQETIMRDAFSERVAAHSSARDLQEENIQFQLRHAQHQIDIQRLATENTRLKLKLMQSINYSESLRERENILPTDQSTRKCNFFPSQDSEALKIDKLDILHRKSCLTKISSSCNTNSKEGLVRQNPTFSLRSRQPDEDVVERENKNKIIPITKSSVGTSTNSTLSIRREFFLLCFYFFSSVLFLIFRIFMRVLNTMGVCKR